METRTKQALTELNFNSFETEIKDLLNRTEKTSGQILKGV